MKKIFISATAQPFTVMFSSDNFEGQHGKNQLKKLFLITLGSWKVISLGPRNWGITLSEQCLKYAQNEHWELNKDFGRLSMNTYPKRALIEGVMSKDLVYMSEGYPGAMERFILGEGGLTDRKMRFWQFYSIYPRF